MRALYTPIICGSLSLQIPLLMANPIAAGTFLGECSLFLKEHSVSTS